MMTALPLVLGSSSRFRSELLQKLRIPFTTASPDIDERAQAGETPQQLVERLAIRKAQAVAVDYPQHLIIGSDQLAVINGEILGKPGNRERAIKQLSAASANTVHFYTALCLLNSQTQNIQSDVIPYDVVFRSLTREQIERYVDAEEPYQCAGSFKSEGLGISLFERLIGDDPNTLIGLPLISLIQMLDKEGLSIP